MASTLPETPGRGRSRFSKVLPTAPRENDSPASIARYYLSSPLPPLPKDAATPSMAIPRRPVGSERVVHSQAHSIASIPSDYSNSPPSRSRSSSVSDTSSSGSTRQSPGDVDVHSRHGHLDVVPATPRDIDNRHDDSDAAPASPRRDVDNRHGDSDAAPPPPPLPPKDQKRRELADASTSPLSQRPKTPPPPHILASPASGFDYSPAPTEIWRRRSEKSDRSIKFPGLKLQASNGSTASPPKEQEPPTERSLPTVPFQLPPRTTSRKPIPARPAPSQPYVMGNELTKLKEKGSRDTWMTEDEQLSQGPRSFSVIQRPATVKSEMEPDKQTEKKTEKDQPETTSRELVPSPFTLADEAIPQLPPKSDARRTKNDRLMPNLSVTGSSEGSAFFSTHSNGSTETVTIKSSSKIPGSNLPLQSMESQAASEVMTPRASSPEEDENRTPPPVKISFPIYSTAVAPPGTVFPGPPIGRAHLDCHQAHRFMRRFNNTLYPVGCMICLSRDTESRWACRWCCLSACGPCMQVLTSTPGRDLKTCLEKVEKTTT
ncbi:uncharacterized protein BP5553_00696 [Venustampulla echinocandica]|uniref:Uncharacterized protein n=1 Tax=Venustampulla echinocandica TaxID=2656787 RepID=A0A370TYW3_9HELO|nr:uncharacterized protein BP5553_00696 [Venustampulla echinocandica]RDL40717.1 hypothetical protein BP5553_00696 [Venustampulla echinocandica]